MTQNFFHGRDSKEGFIKRMKVLKCVCIVQVVRRWESTDGHECGRTVPKELRENPTGGIWKYQLKDGHVVTNKPPNRPRAQRFRLHKRNHRELAFH